ncbi:MAG: hypothetical protein J6K39_02550 [Clostridia bacterium]|nr:hypothetical protein [Clostridia bacterium]
MIEICFVCTGNTCRSVMAERIAKKMAKNKKIKDIKFSSAGIYAKGDNITENAASALKHFGYDGRNRKSVLLKKVKPNVIYVAVTNDHKRFISSKKCLSFEELAGGVSDPYGQNVEVYLQTAKQIEKNVEVLLEKLKALRGEL